MKDFSTRLKQAMEKKGMVQSELSALIGIGKSSISQYLSGKNEPKQPTVKKMADVLEVSEAWLSGMIDFADPLQTEIDEIVNLPVKKAAKLMAKSDQFIRVGLQRGILPFGYAVQLSSKWTYFISPKKFTEFTGIQV